MIPARLPTQIPLPAAGDAKAKRLGHVSDPQALLCEAIEGGDRDAVLRLLDEGGAALANKPLPGSGLTPLAFAATLGSAVVDVFLGRQDVDHDRPSGPQGATPLFIAAARGDAFLAAFLLARTDVDPGATASNGDSPLHAACRFGHEDVVERLLAHPDTRPNENNRAGKTALHEAAIAGAVAAMTVMLRCGRVSADARTRNGSTVILLAASRGDVPMVQLLLKDPSHAHLVDEPAESGVTPLHVAAAKGHEGVVTLLLEHGQNVLARVNQTDRFGQTPLSMARQNGHRQVAALLKRITRVESPARGVTVSNSKGTCVFVLGPHHQKFPHAGIKTLARSHRVRLTECGDGINPESWKKFWKRSVPAGAPLLLLCHGSWSMTESQHKLDLTSGPMVPTVQVVLRYHERGIRRFFLLSCEIGKAAQALATFINEDPAWPKPIDPSLAITLVGSEDETLSSSYDWELTNAIKEIAGDEPGALCAQTVQDIWHICFDLQVGRMIVIHVPAPDTASAMDRLPGQPTRAGILSLKHAMDGGQRSLNMIRALAQRGHLDLGFRDCFDCSLLHVAAIGGCTEIMDLLLDLPGATKEITRLNAFGKSPFHLAVEKGHVDIARRLLDRGASLHLRTSSGMSCLMLAALGPQPEMTRLLLLAGAAANETGPRGRTPLHMAVSVGQHCTVQLLLEAGADITTADDEGLQALAIAAERGDGRCVSVLLAQPGVDVHARTHGGATAEDIARENSHEHIADRLRDAARMRDQSACSVM